MRQARIALHSEATYPTNSADGSLKSAPFLSAQALSIDLPRKRLKTCCAELRNLFTCPSQNILITTQSCELVGDHRCCSASCSLEADSSSGFSGATSGPSDGGCGFLRDFASDLGSSSSEGKRLRAHCLEALSTQEASGENARDNSKGIAFTRRHRR